MKALYYRWWAIAGLYSLALGGMWVWLGRTPWGASHAARWAGQTAVLALLVWLILGRYLPHNRREGETAVLPTLGWGNGLTIGRGLLLAMLGGFIFLPWPLGPLGWLPVILYTAADLCDAFDGFAARRTHHQTELGSILDTEYDGLGVLLVVGLAIWYGQLPWWYAALAAARYLFVAGLAWRAWRGLPVYPLGPSQYRRLTAGFQMGFLTVALWPVFRPPAVWVAGAVFLAPTLILFGRDWLVVSGRLDPHTAAYARWHKRAQEWVLGWSPLLWRGVVGVTAVSTGLFPPVWGGLPAWRALFASWGWADPWLSVAGTLSGGAAVVGLAAVVLGVWGRWMALPLVWATAMHFVAALPLTEGLGRWPYALLLASNLALILTNFGHYALWKPSEGYLFVPLGVTPNTNDKV
jgi:CDP-diacylglycerol---glycerol-3-phosphate 3-phosphatidyltransferase